ncbi:hypothetical protein [Actinoallomurus sp. NPDC050550]|uniref:hypothetical protein n=1 Tax=Actinoallomurus sp. NPDC050550 TaxID=3154937 RepID=UPI0033E575E2
MSKSAEPVIHLPGKVKNGVAMPLCGPHATTEDMICDDPDRVTCRRCVDTARDARNWEERWYRAQEDHYGETL